MRAVRLHILDGRLPKLVSLVAACFFLFSMAAWAAPAKSLSGISFDLGDGPWFVKGDAAEYDQDQGLIVVTGNVKISQEDRELSADRVVYYQKQQHAEAEGNVVIVTPAGTAKGEYLWVDLSRRVGKIRAGELFIRDGHYYLTGESIEKTDSARFRLSESTLTTCDGDCPAWRFRGADIDLTVDGYATIRSLFFEIKDVPVLYAPYFIFPVKVSRQTGFLIPRPEFSSRSGVGIDLPFFWAVSEQVDATFYEHYMSERGLDQGVEFRYLSTDASRGMVQFDYLNDRLDDDNYFDDEYSRTNKSRWWLRSKQDQDLPYDVRVKMDLDLASDQDFLREFNSSFSGFRDSDRAFSNDFHRNLGDDTALYRKSIASATKNWTNVGMNGSLTYYQDLVHEPEDTTPQQLPSLMLSVPDLPLFGSPLFGELDVNHTYFWREDGHKGHRLNAAPSVSLPYEMPGGIVLTPFAGFNETAYYVERGESGVDEGTAFRWDASLGAEANTVLSRVYDADVWGISRIRHDVKPFLRYDYRTVDASGEAPHFDFEDDIDNLNRVSYGLSNVWTARFDRPEGSRTYRDICRLSISQDYNIKESNREEQAFEEDERDPFSGLHFELELYPVNRIQLLADATWDPYDSEFQTLNAYLSGSDNRGDTFGLDYRFTRDRIEQLNAYVRLKITEWFFLVGSNKRSLEGNRTIETGVGVQMLFQCWGVEVKFEKQENETRFQVMFELLGIGKAGPIRGGLG